jgi:hypothetical protein
VDLVGTMIWLESIEVAELVRQVVRCPSIHVPVGIDGVALSTSLMILVLWRRAVTIDLTLVVPCVLAIIAKAE